MGNHKVNWKDIDWKKFHRHVYRLQKRIFKASQRGDVGTMRRLQKLLMKSYAAKCLAVRRVTQDNQGKSTAGVDGVKSLTPNQRLELVETLKLGTKARATRRVMIPKPGKAEKRPLGIPTMRDRALQCLVKLALEPEWEARFEENSYGFRPGRSVHDAIGAIYTSINKKPKYVFDADISKCFDRIDHKALLYKLNTFPALRRQVKSWLKPQKEKVQAHQQKLADIIVKMRAVPQSALIGKLNPVIKGWSNYYSAVVSKETFGKLDALLYWNLRNWGKRRHSKQTGKWVYEQYWHRIQNGDYDAITFSTSQESKNPCWLLSHARTPIVRHKKVKGAKSPFDGDLIYWSTRLGEHPEMNRTVAKLLKNQDGKCSYCRHNFMDGDLMEIDHIVEKRSGGKNSKDNLQLLHRHCHDKKTAMMSVLVRSNIKEAGK